MPRATNTSPTDTLNACPLCGGPSWQTLPTPGHWIGEEVFRELQGAIGLVKCRGCELIFVNPRPSGSKLSAFYAGDTYSCHESSGSSSAGVKADFILERVERHLPRAAPRKVLDYGAGGGGFLAHARDRGWKVRGFEPGRRGVESCRQAGLDVTDIEASLPSQEFGLITMHHVFEHVPDPVEVLRGVSRLLAKDGRLYIEVPNAKSMRARLSLPFLSSQFPVDERYRAYPIHLIYYADQTLRAMLAKAGWVVERTFTLGMGLDEFLAEQESAQEDSHARSMGAGPRRAAIGSKVKKLRHLARDAFLSLGVGENLAAIAYPRRE